LKESRKRELKYSQVGSNNNKNDNILARTATGNKF
jgi:hypothetical protein